MWAIVVQTEAHYGMSVKLTNEAGAKKALAKLTNVEHQDGMIFGRLGETKGYVVYATIHEVKDGEFGVDTGMRKEEQEIMKTLIN